jgi:hypothetical protein
MAVVMHNFSFVLPLRVVILLTIDLELTAGMSQQLNWRTDTTWVDFRELQQARQYHDTHSRPVNESPSPLR